MKAIVMMTVLSAVSVLTPVVATHQWVRNPAVLTRRIEFGLERLHTAQAAGEKAAEKVEAAAEKFAAFAPETQPQEEAAATLYTLAKDLREKMESRIATLKGEMKEVDRLESPLAGLLKIGKQLLGEAKFDDVKELYQIGLDAAPLLEGRFADQRKASQALLAEYEEALPRIVAIETAAQWMWNYLKAAPTGPLTEEDKEIRQKSRDLNEQFKSFLSSLRTWSQRLKKGKPEDKPAGGAPPEATVLKSPVVRINTKGGGQ